MPEYIEREALLRHLNDIWLSAKPNDSMPDDDRHLAMVRCMGLNDAMDAVKSIPAADVRPVLRGRWIRHYEQADTGEDIITYPCGWVCSECGRWESEDEPFCNCGAMMEEEGE